MIMNTIHSSKVRGKTLPFHLGFQLGSRAVFYLRPVNKIIISVMIIFLLVCAVDFSEAQEGGSQARPMRVVAPDSALPLATHTSTYLFQPAANSLLTEKALSQPLTQQYIAQYSNPRGVATLNAVMERAKFYLPFIKEEVEKRGLPPELAYLPIIESGFQITAKSRSGAMGLWQFMMNSISPYNMKVTELVDERRDFIKSTMGALQKLEDEYKRLGDWELTLAAYNSGLNAITRTVQRTGRNDYWELSSKKDLRPETINFVPRLIAVSYVVSQPRRYGIDAWHAGFDWIAIPLQRQVSLEIIAEETGINRNLLRSLNAELVHGITPVDSNYRLKIPVEYFEKINEVLERDDIKLVRYYYHVVRQGDTLWSMTRQYNIPQAMIEQHNPGIAGRYLKIGETVIVPAFTDAPAPPRPAAVTTTAASQNNSNAAGSHTVQRGETFWALGRIYGLEPQVIAQANGMQLSDTLHAGRTIKIPIR